MPQLTVKTAHIEKLKQLGLYDKWIANIKLQWDGWNHIYKDRLQKADDWNTFIHYSFRWDDTLERSDFWENIANKLS